MESLVDMMTSRSARIGTLGKILKVLGEQKPHECFHCVKCTSGCPAAEVLEVQPHNLVNLARIGFADDLLESESIWCCAMCLKCKERCPQRVAPADLILALRNVAVEAGVSVPEGLSKALSSILEAGFIQPPLQVITREFEVCDRGSLKLPPLRGPISLDRFREAVLTALGGRDGV